MNKKVGKLIKKRRRKFDLTQEELANILGVSASAVSCWETNTCFPEKETVSKLAKVLKIKEDKFYEKEEKEVETFDLLEMRKKDEKIQNFLYMSVMFIIVFVLVSTVSTVLYDFFSKDLYLTTYSSVSTKVDEEVLKEADKNLEIIKNSKSTKIDEKDKKEIVEILSALSYKLHNDKGLKKKINNYNYTLWIAKELDVLDEYDKKNLMNNSKHMLAESAYFSFSRIDAKINKPKKEEGYSFLKQYPEFKIYQNLFINSYNQRNRIVQNVVSPEYKYRNIIGESLFTYNFNYHAMEFDSLYLLITEKLMEVGEFNG